MVFGDLTVIKRGPNTKGKAGIAQWWCECNCENTELVLVAGTKLRNGTVRSCPACARKTASEKLKKYNKYDLSGEYGIGYTYNTDSYGRNEFYFDLEDYDKIKDFCWNFTKPNNYVQARDCVNKTMVQMQQIIMPAKNGYETDHIHGNKSRNDNRKSNLRLSTHSQNLKNLSLSKENKSGVTGVYWHAKRNKWIAYITVNGERMHLGYFNDFDDAVKARKEAEFKYFGEWSSTYSKTI